MHSGCFLIFLVHSALRCGSSGSCIGSGIGFIGHQ